MERPIFDRLVKQLSTLAPVSIIATVEQRFGKLKVCLAGPDERAAPMIEAAARRAAVTCDRCGAVGALRRTPDAEGSPMRLHVGLPTSSRRPKGCSWPFSSERRCPDRSPPFPAGRQIVPDGGAPTCSGGSGTFTTEDGVQIYYKNWGSGHTVVFSHGWPLTAYAWGGSDDALWRAGVRTIAHDRRGHGRSGQPWSGNDMD